MDQLGPVQFDFQKLWFHSRRELMEKEPIKKALADIQRHWIDIAEFKYEEESPHDEELAREELLLDRHIGQVKIKDLHWLRQTFENIDLAELSFAIAQELMPGKTWEIIERGEDAIVTDAERSIVFDIKNGRTLSAGASLLSAGDQKYQPTRAVLEESTRWLSGRVDSSRKMLDRLRKDLDRFDNPGAVLDLSSRRPY